MCISWGVCADSDGNLSESEAELDNEQSQVTLPQDLPGRGNTKSAKSAIRSQSSDVIVPFPCFIHHSHSVKCSDLFGQIMINL